MPAKVYFHEGFYNGDTRTQFFSDFLALTTEEFDLLFDFITKVKLGGYIEGKNKPSWIEDDGSEIKSVALKSYKTCKLWHYHVGPYKKIPFISGKIRDINLSGRKSAAIVHYKWFDAGQTKLFIIAFSSEHKPYPKPNDSYNPLSMRSGLTFLNKLIEM